MNAIVRSATAQEFDIPLLDELLFIRLDLPDTFVMQDGRHAYRIRASTSDRIQHILRSSCASMRDHWDGNRLGNCSREVKIKTFACSLALNRSDNDLTCTQFCSLNRPLDCIHTGSFATIIDEGLISSIRFAHCLNAYHNSG